VADAYVYFISYVRISPPGALGFGHFQVKRPEPIRTDDDVTKIGDQYATEFFPHERPGDLIVQNVVLLQSPAAADHRFSWPMQSFFSRVPAARWPSPFGRLHVYAFAGPEVTTLTQAYQRLLAERGVTGLSRQPAPFLHLTVEMLLPHVDDLTGEQLGRLRDALAEQIAALPAFELQVGPALLSLYSITLDAVPDEPWQQLRQAVRTAATAALGDDAVPPQTRSSQPHVTIGYATGDTDIGPHVSALNDLRLPRAVLTVDEVHLVAVDQDPAAGIYTWPAPLATFPLWGSPSEA
jgi:2'-5' RNA ligase